MIQGVARGVVNNSLQSLYFGLATERNLYLLHFSKFVK